jgi:hypothetical protein
MIRPFLLCALLLTALGGRPAFAAQDGLEPEQPYRFSLLEFRLGPMAVFQTANNYSITGFVAWVPKLRLFDDNYLRASVGAFPLRNNNTSNQNFFVLDAQLYLGVPIDNGMLEVGGGLQSWGGGNGGTRPVVGANIIWPLDHLELPLLDHFFLGYTVYFGDPYTSHQFRAGVGVTF